VLAALVRRAFAATVSMLAAGALLTVAGTVEGLRTSIPVFQAEPPASRPLGRICAGDTVARIAIPRLDVEAPVREGIDEATLAHGPAHVPGTALPGEDSGRKHAVIAIARDSGVSFAAELMLGDRVELRTPFGLRTYRVVERRMLKAEEVRIEPTDEAALTLIAPYPPDSIGPAPLRLAVRAEPVAAEPELASSAMRSATRSTGQSFTLAEVALSWALREGR
jgi:LPXTG-site transpeptidase (sortase) family protein